MDHPRSPFVVDQPSQMVATWKQSLPHCTGLGSDPAHLLHPSNRQDSGCSSTGVPGGLSGDSQRLPAYNGFRSIRLHVFDYNIAPKREIWHSINITDEEAQFRN